MTTKNNIKLRLTPLNIVTALSLALLISTMFQPEKRGQHFDLGAFHQFLLGSLIVVSFISDLIFRFAFKDLKKIWLVELVFIIFTVVLVLILKK